MVLPGLWALLISIAAGCHGGSSMPVHDAGMFPRPPPVKCSHEPAVSPWLSVSVELGEDAPDYRAIKDGDVVALSNGDQGSYVIPIAARLKGLPVSSSTTSLSICIVVTSTVGELGNDGYPRPFTPNPDGTMELSDMNSAIDPYLITIHPRVAGTILIHVSTMTSSIASARKTVRFPVN
jgi:hypothetical protein